jgi:hypothetical protein
MLLVLNIEESVESNLSCIRILLAAGRLLPTRVTDYSLTTRLLYSAPRYLHSERVELTMN